MGEYVSIFAKYETAQINDVARFTLLIWYWTMTLDDDDDDDDDTNNNTNDAIAQLHWLIWPLSQKKCIYRLSRSTKKF